MREVDQTTGADLNPRKENKTNSDDLRSNPSMPHSARLSKMDEDDGRMMKKISSPERFELAQLRASGVLPVRAVCVCVLLFPSELAILIAFG